MEQSDIEALEFMKNDLWDKSDKANIEEASNDAQRNRTERKSPEALRSQDRKERTAVRELPEETSDS